MGNFVVNFHNLDENQLTSRRKPNLYRTLPTDSLLKQYFYLASRLGQPGRHHTDPDDHITITRKKNYLQSGS